MLYREDNYVVDIFAASCIFCFGNIFGRSCFGRRRLHFYRRGCVDVAFEKACAEEILLVQGICYFGVGFRHIALSSCHIGQHPACVSLQRKVCDGYRKDNRSAQKRERSQYLFCGCADDKLPGRRSRGAREDKNNFGRGI